MCTYQWADLRTDKEKKGNFGNRIVSFQDPSKATELIEYAVFSRSPTLLYEVCVRGRGNS